MKERCCACDSRVLLEYLLLSVCKTKRASTKCWPKIKLPRRDQFCELSFFMVSPAILSDTTSTDVWSDETLAFSVTWWPS